MTTSESSEAGPRARTLTDRIRGLSDWGELAAIVLVCFGPIIAASWVANLRGIHRVLETNGRLLRLFLVEALATTAALSILHLRGVKPLFGRMRATLRDTGSGLLLYVGLYLFNGVVGILIYMLLSGSRRFDRLEIVHRASWWAAIPFFFFNSFFEERFVTGYLVDRLDRYGPWVAVAASVLTRLSYHTYQGVFRLTTLVPFGVACGWFYWRKRNLYPLIIVHTLTNALIFWRSSG